MQFESNIIDTSEGLQQLIDYYNELKPEYIFIDVETNSPIEKTALLYGIGLCFDETQAFYFPIRWQNGTEVWNETDLSTISQFLLKASKQSKLVNHNIIFDVLVLKNNLGIDLTDYIYSDTILIYHSLFEEGVPNSSRPFGLKEIAEFEFGPEAIKAKERLYESIKANGGKVLKDQIDMYLADSNILADYCQWDVILTCKLFNKLQPEVFKQGLDKLFYVEEVIPLYKEVTIPMKNKGFPIDVEHFSKLKREIEQDINKLEDEIIEETKNDAVEFVEKLLDKDYPVSKKGKFPQYLAQVINAPLPVSKTGKVTIAKAAIEKQLAASPQFKEFYEWLLQAEVETTSQENKDILLQKGGRKTRAERIIYGYITEANCRQAQELWFFDSNPDSKSVFNFKSNDHLANLLCDSLGFRPLERTPTGKPKIDDDFLEAIKDKVPFVSKLVDYKKLNKLLGTYIDGILNRAIDGVLYTSMLQFGTTSGRYSARNPNLQNLPRVKDADSSLSELVLKYVNSIRKGLIAGPGKKIIDADYNQLEPKCFAEMSGESKLKEVFIKGEDIYSRVAIDVNKLETEYSADKKATNYLGKLNKELRQLWKVPPLGIVYGMEEARLMEAIKCSRPEATSIINGYLNTYPNLKKYMKECDYEAKTKGYVKTIFGRIRHLNEVRSIAQIYGDSILDYRWANRQGLTDKRRLYKNGLNNAKNFKIQGLGAHIINRSMIALAKQIKELKLDAYIALMIHDQVICISNEKDVDKVKEIMQYCMEHTVKLSIPLTAEPQIASNLADSH